MKQFIKFFTALAFTGIIGTNAAFSQVTVIDSGTCGANLTWKLTNNGTLTVSGSGNMYDYSYSTTPWCSSYWNFITTVVIDSGVTIIGNSTFMYHRSITFVTIGNSVTTIGDAAFYDCKKLQTVTIPNSVTTIGDGAFYN